MGKARGLFLPRDTGEVARSAGGGERGGCGEGPLRPAGPPPPHRGGGTGKACVRCFTRLLAEGLERDAERRTSVRRRVCCYRFDEARTLRAAVIHQRPVRWPCSGLTGTRVSGFPDARRSERTNHYRLRHILLPPTTPTAGGPDQHQGPGPSEYPPRTCPRSTAPRRRKWSLAMRPFLATRWDQYGAGFSAGDKLARKSEKWLISLG